ncbi:MAG: hypothetical protein NTV86_10285 [Planctomycetota bacterium]|nr:hypothetical protein [Planctomycetota bacterium]
MTARTADNSGFIMVTVLLLLAIAGVLAASAARYNCAQALQAGASLEQLQVRWGSESCRAVCLAAAERYVVERDEGAPEALAARVVLGEVRFHLRLADEQAKANVNALAARVGADSIGDSLWRLQDGLVQPLPVQLRPCVPLAGAVGGTVNPTPYLAFDQVFAFDHPSELMPLEPGEEFPVGRVTCWGDGRVNFKRADPVVLREATAAVLDDVQRAALRTYRDEHPDATLTEALRSLTLDKDKTAAAEALLTDESLCYSLWVVGEGATRKYYRLYVGGRGLAGGFVTRSYAW